ncbi:MAG: hypothetical protein KBF45_04820 [Cyclobacteriaceae bacterium]|jgi:signal transduction histidine kinase|nr:hypothetical protein [Cyclobacteriaceae bacterium]
MIKQTTLNRRITLTLLIYTLIWSIVLERYGLVPRWEIQRYGPIVIFTILYVGSFKNDWIRTNMRYGLYGTVFLWTILSSLEAALSPYHNFYLLRPLISVAIVSFVFLERKWLNGYLLFNFIITSIVSFIMDIPDELEILFLTGFACVTLSVCLLMNTILQLQTQYKSIVISLAEKDKKIEEYAHMNSHVVRAPLARLMGLIRLLGLDLSTHELTDKVQKEATDLDKVIRKAQRLLE